MTFIKRNKVLALVLAILITVATLTVGTIVAASAQDEEETNQLSVTFDESTASVSVFIDGKEEKMVSGQVYDIKHGADVKLRIVAKAGYTIEDEGGLFEVVDGVETQVLPNKDVGGSVHPIGPFNRDYSFTLRCVERKFKIFFAPSEFATDGELDYTFENGAPNLNVIFNGDAVTIPNPYKVGYRFLNWTMVTSEGKDLGLKEINSTFQLNNEQLLVADLLDTGMIFLRANFEPIKYLVTRYDYVYDANGSGYKGKELSSKDTRYFAEENMGLVLNSADWGGPKDYIGYKLHEGFPNHTLKVNVVEGNYKNDLDRFYDPIVYTLRLDFDGGVESDAPATHTYNANTTIPSSTRVGYTFIGWTVIVDGVEVGTITANADGELILASETEAYAATELDEETGEPVIHLKAKWEPDRYTIIYDSVGGAIADGTPEEHVYGTPTEIPNPILKGYAFLGWYINGTDVLVEPVDGKVTLDPNQLPLTGGQAISLKAKWEVKTFTVVLDGNAGSDIVQTMDPSFTVTYDTPVPDLTQIPQRLGYYFRGFATEPEGGTLYIDAEGKGIGNWLEDGVTVLYAQWEAKTYHIVLTTNSQNYNDCIDYIEINGVRYEMGTEYSIRYRETVTVRIVTKKGFKLVNWRGGAQEHSSDFEVEYRHLEPNDRNDIHFIIFPVVESPDFVIDYENETLTTVGGSIPEGIYYIYDESGALWHSLEVDQNGVMRLDGDVVEGVSIPEELFGTTISIIRRAPKNSLRADGDAVLLSVSERPEAPAVVITPDVFDREIYINLHSVSGEDAVYQYAISIDASGKGLIWQDSNRFENLDPGSTYYVYVRVKHTQDQPHSRPTVAAPVHTNFEAYLLEVAQRLEAMRRKEDGENVDRLLQNAIDEINALKQDAPNNGFYAAVEQVIDSVEQAIPLARQMDIAIASLTEKVERMEASGSYDQSGKNALRAILSDAIAQISVAATAEDVEACYKQADKDLDAVPVTKVTASDNVSNTTVQITVGGGIDPQNKPTLLRYPTVDYLRAKIDEAINEGNVIVYQTGLTVASALEELRTQDVMAAFRLTLGNTDSEGEYEVRLLIPSDLRDVQAIRVGYYNDETQMLEILTSRVEGDYVIFQTNRISDFILFGDPTVSLTVAIVLLGATLLIQLIAIVLLVVFRKKALAGESAKCIAAPVAALTIRFLPANGLIVVILLAAAVLVCTCILLWMLLTTQIRRKGELSETATEETSEVDMTDAAPIAAYDPEAEESITVFAEDGEMNDPSEPAFAVFENDPQDEQLDEEAAFASAFFVDTDEIGDEEEEVVYEEYVTEEYVTEDEGFAEYDDTDGAEEVVEVEYYTEDEGALFEPDDAAAEDDGQEVIEEIVYVEEDELGDIDDSYLAETEEGEEVLEDIDDSKEQY